MRTWLVNLFLISLLTSLLFFAGANFLQQNLENWLYQKELADLGLPAKLLDKIPGSDLGIETYKPWRDWQVEAIESKAKAALAVFVDMRGKQRILYHKNSQTPLPIASLTKLMTALVAREFYNLTDILEIKTRLAEDNGFIRVGESFEVRDLLHFSLLASNNTATYALAGFPDRNAFVTRMNSKAEELDMRNTRFFNATGLDPDKNPAWVNTASASDLIPLALATKQDMVLEDILVLPQASLRAKDSGAIYTLKNTNLLIENPQILWGKTGFTPKALGNLLVVAKAPDDKGLFIAVVLGSQDRFGEMKELLEWIRRAYIF